MNDTRPATEALASERRPWWDPLVTLPVSALTIGGGFAIMGVGAGLAALLEVFGVTFQQSFEFLGRPSMAICPRLTLSRFEFIYDPDFDPDRRSVFVQNHVSMLDGHVACMTIPHPFCGLHLASHFKVPGYGWIMRLARSIPIERGETGQTERIAAEARRRIQDMNLSIVAYPEAHRTRTGQVQPFRTGVFFMARAAGAPVVPLCVRGLFEVNRPKSARFRPGRVEIYVGPQFETEGLTDDAIRALAEEVRQVHVAFVDRGELPERVREARARGETRRPRRRRSA